MNHDLTHIGLRVTDVAASIAHFESVLGLEVREQTEEGASLALPGQPPCVIVIRDSTPACDHIALRTDAATLAEVRRRAESAGFDVQPARWLEGEAIHLSAPNKLGVEVGLATSPTAASHARAVGPTIEALDHVSLTAADLDATIAFFRDILGFRLSDSVEDVRHWLRCNPNHHTVAVFAGEDGMQHYAFRADGIAELQKLCDLLAYRGQNLLWGLGRHGLGANIFSYHLDPDGAVLEVCSDMIQVDDEDAWEARVWRADTLASAVMWGPPPPAEFRGLLIPTREVPA